MIRAMLELRGNQVDAWYQAVNANPEGPQVAELMQFIEREELYLLKIHLAEGGVWKEQGIIMGQGPFINENRVVDLDLSNVPGDTLRIRMNPPVGFWAIDYIGIVYEDPHLIGVTEVAFDFTEDQHGKNISALIEQRDSVYQVLPKVGDWMKMTFPVPSQQEATERSVFLKTSGYYEIHLSKEQPEQKERIQAFLNTPGLIVQYAIEEYMKWSSEVSQTKPSLQNQ
jgi:hypothetical protein